MSTALPMPAWEIAREYREAKDPKAQIQILADQNATTRDVIIDVLLDAGEAVDLRWKSRKRAAKKNDPGPAGAEERPGPDSDGPPVPEENHAGLSLATLCEAVGADGGLLQADGKTVTGYELIRRFGPDGSARGPAIINLTTN